MKKSALILTFFFLHIMGIKSQNNYPFTVQKSGSGSESILLIPGFSCSGDVYKETLPFFEKNFTCYTLTMAGFAGTPAQKNASFRNWEKEIAQFIKDKNMRPAIIGHSMGGALAMALAADFPDLVQKIVVLDALPCLAALSNPSFKSNPENDCNETIQMMKQIPDSQFAVMQNNSMKYMVSDPSKTNELVKWSLASDRETYAGVYCDFMNTDLRNDLSRIKCPSLVLLEPSFKQMENAIQEQYKLLQQADFRYAEKGFHFIMYDDFDWYIRQITTFLNNK